MDNNDDKYHILTKHIGIKKLKKIHDIDIEKFFKAMDVYADKVLARGLREMKTDKEKIKLSPKGRMIKMNISDYAERNGWDLDSVEYIHPGIVRVRMKNVSEHDNPRKSYFTDISDGYMKQICSKMFGHQRFEQLDQFIEESLIKKYKNI